MTSAPERPSRHCLQRLRQYFSRLSSAEQKVAEFILQHPTRALNASVEELAATCGTSPSTVVRLAKDVGFNGMKSMRLALAQEVGTLIPRMFEGTAAPAGGDYVTELLENTVLGLRETAAAFDYPSLQRAVDAIREANRIDVCGAGSSYLVGLDLVEKLKKLGINASTFANNYMQAISAAGLSAGDVAIGISYSGETRNTVDTLEMARKQGATIIAVVNFTDSTMVEIADILVPTSVTRHVFPDGSLGGRIAQLFTIDVLFIKLFLSDPDRFRRAYRKYNEILMNKVKKERGRGGAAGVDEARERESPDEERAPASEILKLLGG